jgi:hypothetical protein
LKCLTVFSFKNKDKMKKLIQLMAALAFTLFIACQKDNTGTLPSSPRAVNLLDTLSIKMSETVFSGDFSIQLDSIVDDSRCPSNAVCIWQGLADAKLIVKKGSDSQTIRLKTVSKMDTMTVFNRLIRILNVSPYPNGQGRIPQGDYVVRLVVR